ncbi:hypothetical protein VTI74DRAFT_1704 [Chaetomium olivicolor]
METANSLHPILVSTRFLYHGALKLHWGLRLRQQKIASSSYISDTAKMAHLGSVQESGVARITIDDRKTIISVVGSHS